MYLSFIQINPILFKEAQEVVKIILGRSVMSTVGPNALQTSQPYKRKGS